MVPAKGIIQILLKDEVGVYDFWVIDNPVVALQVSLSYL